MHKARAFFYVAAGIFLLALSYHLGARNAGAQVGSIVGISTSGPRMTATCFTAVHVVTATGDLYERLVCNGQLVESVTYIGNFWSGGPTPAQQESWGALKSRYRGQRGAAQAQDK